MVQLIQFDTNILRIFSFHFVVVAVILARVLRKSNRKINYSDVYKIEVKKAYKVREKEIERE